MGEYTETFVSSPRLVQSQTPGALRPLVWGFSREESRNAAPVLFSLLAEPLQGEADDLFRPL